MWFRYLCAAITFGVGLATVVWTIRRIRELNRFLVAVGDEVGPEALKILRGRGAPMYLVFARVKGLSFRSEPRALELRHFPALDGYQRERRPEVLRQYRQELGTRARMIEAMTVVGTAAYGVLAAMAAPALVRAAWGQLSYSRGGRSLIPEALHTISGSGILFLIGFVFLILPLVCVAWARRQLRLGEIHIKRIDGVLDSFATSWVPFRSVTARKSARNG
jgi:hypothetical protein